MTTDPPASETVAQRSPDGWIGEFDGLRGLAVGLVVGHHAYWDGGFAVDWPWSVPLEVGMIGVDLFFVLSGFLITGILVKSRAHPRYWSRFALRRALRILPLYTVFVGVIALRVRGMPIDGPAQVPFPAYLLFVQNWWMGLGFDRPGDADPTWSLAIEEQFYLLWPLVVWACSLRTLTWLLVAIVAGVPFLRLWVLGAFGSDAVYFWTPCRIDTLAIGALAWLLWEHGPAWGRRAAAAAAAPLLLMVGSGALAGGVDRTWAPFVSVGYSSIAFASAALLLAVRAGRWPRVARALQFGPLVWVGKVSFGIYLWHRFALGGVGALVAPALGPPGASVAAAAAYLAGGLAFGVLLAWASWRYWEAPWLSLKDRVAP